MHRLSLVNRPLPIGAERLESRRLLSGGVVAPAVEVQSPGGPPPHVADVYVSSTRWGAPFKEHLQSIGYGDATHGWALRQPDDTAWSDLDRVTVIFVGDVVVDAEDLVLRSARPVDYPVAAFEAEAGPNWAGNTVTTAVWTLGRPIANDRVILEVDGDVPSGVYERITGLFLDGDGDGDTPGGDFERGMVVVVGDVGRDGRVNALDVAGVKRNLGRSIGDGRTGPDSYSPWYDINGDGRINAIDVAAVRRNLGQRAPQWPAALAPLPAATTVAEDLFASTPILA